MATGEDGQGAERKPLVLVLEYHSAGAPVVGDAVRVVHASLYLVSGVSAEGMHGVADMRKPGAAFVQLAERLGKSDAEHLADALAETLAWWDTSGSDMYV